MRKLFENLANPKVARDRFDNLLFCGALVAASVFTFSDGNLDVLGDGGTKITSEQAHEIAQQRKMNRYSASDLATQYGLLYLNDREVYGVEEERVFRLVGSNGLAGAIREAMEFGIANGSEGFTYGQDCLAGSAFDTRPSEIRGRKVQGDISAVASLTVEEDLVTIRPAATNAEPLRFVQEELLEPANNYTEQTLEAYGCAPKAIL